MKPLNCWLLVAGLFVTGLARAQSTSSIAAQILPLLNEQLLAANAHDADRFLATYVHSPDLVFIANGQDGKPSDGTAVITTVWRRLPVGWRATYAHESWVR